MIDINFKDDYILSRSKNINLSIGGVEYDNENIVQESMKLSGILMPDLQLKFGGCNAKQFSLSMISDSASDLVGQDMIVSIESPNGTLQIGKFTITSFNRGNKNSRVIDLVSINDMSKTNVDVTDWYNELEFPMTIKALRDSLFTHLHIPQEQADLPLDSILIQKGYENTSVIANTILRDICEVNGRFGDINNQGVFVYRKLKLSADSIDITGDEYSTIVKQIEYEDYVTKKIDSLIIKRDGVSYGYLEGVNTYVVNGSLFNGLTNAELEVICPLIFNEIKDIAYTPTKITMRGLPYLELGDRLRYKGVEFYLFTRDMTGIQSLKDYVTSEGAEYLKADLNSVQEQIANLKNSDASIRRTIEETEEGIRIQVERLDGRIDDVDAGGNVTYESDAEPTLTNYPASDWTAEEYEDHIGDLCYVDGACYRFKSFGASYDVFEDYSWYEYSSYEKPEYDSKRIIIDYGTEKSGDTRYTYKHYINAGERACAYFSGTNIYLVTKSSSTNVYARRITNKDNVVSSSVTGSSASYLTNYRRASNKIYVTTGDLARFVKGNEVYIFADEQSALNYIDTGAIANVLVEPTKIIPAYGWELQRDDALVEKEHLITEINATPEGVAIQGDKIDLRGTVTANDYFKILQDGSMECSSAKITGGNIEIETNDETYDVISLKNKIDDDTYYEATMRPNNIGVSLNDKDDNEISSASLARDAVYVQEKSFNEEGKEDGAYTASIGATSVSFEESYNDGSNVSAWFGTTGIGASLNGKQVFDISNIDAEFNMPVTFKKDIDVTRQSVSDAINKLTTGSSTPQDADYYVCQYAGGGTETTSYHRRPTSALWDYMVNKADTIRTGLTKSIYLSTATKEGLDTVFEGLQVGKTYPFYAVSSVGSFLFGQSAGYLGVLCKLDTNTVDFIAGCNVTSYALLHARYTISTGALTMDKPTCTRTTRTIK